MSFASRQDVMYIVEHLIAHLWPTFLEYRPFNPEWLSRDRVCRDHIPENPSNLIPVKTYETVMQDYGSDKPDLRFDSRIRRIDHLIPQTLKMMLTALNDPIIEILKINMEGTAPAESGKFITDFLDAPSSLDFLQNPAGAPGITVYDPSKPLNGLASFGHEAAGKVEDMLQPGVGDIIVVQARVNSPFTGGSTQLGNLRHQIHAAAVEKRLIRPPYRDSFLWVTDFPLFSPVENSKPGQDGEAGICSTHHPFTAPLNSVNFEQLATNPLACLGDHYDLVINGIEVGGGSRRIHDAWLQKYILQNVLKLSAKRWQAFLPLLNALSAGCPPHAGFALGFDRLVAILTRQGSVRDVIAFPKWGQGEDKMVGSPAKVDPQVLQTYHLKVL